MSNSAKLHLILFKFSKFSGSLIIFNKYFSYLYPIFPNRPDLHFLFHYKNSKMYILLLYLLD